MPVELKKEFKKPTNAEVEKAFYILDQAFQTAESFFQIFCDIRKGRKARGNPTYSEQDLLRAMFVFSASGLDSTIKQLSKDTYSIIIEYDEGANRNFKEQLRRIMIKNDMIKSDVLINALLIEHPKDYIMDYFINSIISNSLQSKSQLLKVGSFFNIKSTDLINNPDSLTKIFKVRNDIIHEMDINFDSRDHNRTRRSIAAMVKYTNTLYVLGGNFLSEVDRILSTR